MEDKNMRKSNSLRKVVSESYDTYLIRSIVSDPDGNETVVTYQKKVKRGMSPRFEDIYKVYIGINEDSITESFFGGDRFWYSLEDGTHREVYIQKVS